ncbi:MAG: DNA internalization-related competence protein ComEC/Rec2 [Oscillospiraceae bacterium]|jgi:competence protein ComEC
MRKLGTFCVSFSISIFLAQYFLGVQWLLPMGLACGILALLGSFVFAERKRRILLIGIGLSVGFLWNWGYNAIFFAPLQTWDRKIETCRAEVCSFPEKTRYGVKAEVKTGEGLAATKVLLYAEQEYQTLKPGDQIEFTAEFAVSNLIREEEVTYHTANGIYLLAYQKGEIRLLDEKVTRWVHWPLFAAQILKNEISRLYPREEASFLNALIMGDCSGLSESLETALSRTGLTHIVSVSGMHLSFLAGLALLLPGSRRKKAMFAVPILLFFMAATGGPPSVMRAGLMQILFLFAPMFSREPDPPTSLAFALSVLLAINPFAAANIGLQLSFASVAGLYLMTERIDFSLQTAFQKRKRDTALPKGVRMFCAVTSSSVGAMIFTVPLSAYYFGLVSISSLFANLLVLWAISAVFIGGLLSGVFGMVFFAMGKGLSIFVSPLVQYILLVIKTLGKWSLAAIPTVHVYSKLWLVFSYTVLVLYFIWPILQDKRKGQKKEKRTINRMVLPIGLCVASFCIATLLNYFTYNHGNLTLMVLDVGQGQCAVLLSGGKAVVVDCGGSGPKNAGGLAADYLQGMGIQEVECLVLSHYHDDHTNGVTQLLDRMKVLRIAAPVRSEEKEAGSLAADILPNAEQDGTELYLIDTTMQISFGHAALTLYPPFGSETENERGLTALCSAQSFDVLLTGDMGEALEEIMVSDITLPDLEVLVAGHHGSKYSTGDLLLDTTTPEIVVISVGRNNSYGHPAPETLARLVARNIEIYRTDEMGMITIYG